MNYCSKYTYFVNYCSKYTNSVNYCSKYTYSVNYCSKYTYSVNYCSKYTYYYLPVADCRMARWKRFAESGETRWNPTLADPALSEIIYTSIKIYTSL